VIGSSFVFLLALAATSAPDSSGGYWFDSQPSDAAEAELRQALSAGGFGGPKPTAEALKRVSAAHPGTLVSGLAQLAAGLTLVDGQGGADAIACLTHPDVARTALQDLALRAKGDALEQSGDKSGAAEAYFAAAAARPEGPVVCEALLRAAEVLTTIAPNKAIEAAEKAQAPCRGEAPRALLALAALQESRRQAKAAAETFARIDGEYPLSPEAKDAARHLVRLGGVPLSGEPRVARDLKKADLLYEAQRFAEAVPLYRSVLESRSTAIDPAQVRLRLGRSEAALGRVREAQAELTPLAAQSPYAAEAAYQLAKLEARRSGKPDAFESVATRFPGTPWGEEALLALANHYQKDFRSDDALPHFRRLLAEYPDGVYADRATWRVAWADIQAGRYEDAAQNLERAARLHPTKWAAGGFLYWAGRARHELKQDDRARALLEETVQRFKHAYYGLRAQEMLAKLPAGPVTPTPEAASPASAAEEYAANDPRLARLRQLLLIDRWAEAKDEIGSLPASPRLTATLAWAEARAGHLRPAIIAMKRAYPDWVTAAGDRLPEQVWKILYPLEYSGLLQQKAAETAIDPALVAAVICQESTFDAGAVSTAGARGLMQVMPKTGRVLARALNTPYRTQALHDPATSLEFGTYYLRSMLDRFGGRVERALAAYNAGPHRVDAWTAERADISAEEFIESIPFTETRNYVMTILAGLEHYRRLYSFPAPAAAPRSTPVASTRLRP